MAKRLMAIPLALAVVLGSQVASFAQDSSTERNQTNPSNSSDQTTPNTNNDPTNPTTHTDQTNPKPNSHQTNPNSDPNNPNYSNPNVGINQNRTGGGGGAIRADLIKGATDTLIADLPAGHWATYASQIAVANNLLTLENGQIMGERTLTADELHHAMESLVNTSENIAGKGALVDLRAELGVIPTGDQAISRLELAQTISRFLDAANKVGLVAVGASRQQASQFKDLPSVPPAVEAVTDKYKIMAGFADHTFKPNAPVTRYQLAAIGKQVLDFMRTAPIAQRPVTQPNMVAVPAPVEAPEMAVVPARPLPRRNFRQNAPIALSWQALNQSNLSNATGSNGSGFGAFSAIPVSGMFTGYQGPVMLQNVTNFRYNVYQDNLLDSEFRIGYANFKLGAWQLIPYVGANVGVGASIPSSGTQYDTYVGATYGGIISWMPMSLLEMHASLGQAALLGAGRWNSSFQPTNYPAALGTLLTNYGVGADFYVQPNICLTLGLDNWQQPADLRTASTAYSAGALNTLGGSVGVGFRY